MHEIRSKHFGPIRDDYAFFLQHATEAEADVRAHAPHLQGLSVVSAFPWLAVRGAAGGITV
jgi:hypothetical protein